MDIRPPVSPGRFYAADPDLLFKQVQACYSHPSGPGSFPSAPSPEATPQAIIVPHGALGHSGPIAAHAYALLAASLLDPNATPLQLIVLLGPDHLGLGAPVSGTRLAYASPCGVIPTDTACLGRLYDQATQSGVAPFLADSPAGHLSEHSLENQLPFIQHLMSSLQHLESSIPAIGNRLNALRLVPLTMRAQDLSVSQALGELLDRHLPDCGVLLVATSDMSHCGPYYGNQPQTGGTPTQPISDWCQQQTWQAIDAIVTLQPELLLARLDAGNLSLCGAGCIAATLEFAGRRGASQAKLLAVADSVSVATGWRGLSTAYPYGIEYDEWKVLEQVDPDNPVGFAAFALN